ncbi:MAG: IS6 family transposase [Paracoccaceae bacterium]
MTKRKNSLGFKGHRFPPEIIEYAVWLCFRFGLGMRDVEDLLAECGITVSHETIRFWVVKFGRQYAKLIRRDRPPVSDIWHLDEVVISIRGKKHWLWRAVDQNWNSLELLVQSRRNTKAAMRFKRKLMKQYGVPRVMIKNKLRSYGSAKRDLAPGLEHRSHKGLNNAAEVSHKPTRRRERVMGRFKSPRQAQKFLAALDQINVLFRPRCHRLSARSYRHAKSGAFGIWHDLMCEIAAG